MVLFKEFGILNSYTIESTFYGGNKPKNRFQVKVDNNFEENLQVIKDDDSLFKKSTLVIQVFQHFV